MSWTKRSGLDWVALVLDPERGLDASAEREARLCIAGWQHFARKYRLDFRAELGAEDLSEVGEIGEVLFALGGLGFPVSRVRGWTQGTWEGRRCYGFHALDATEAGSIFQLRFTATRLAREFPDVVQHRLLDTGSSLARTWHPRRDDYRVYSPPEPPRPAPRQRGRIGRMAAEALDKFFKPIPRQLHTDRLKFAKEVALAGDRCGVDLFRYPWAVKGSWLVTWKSDGTSGDGHPQRAKFMDHLTELATCLEQTPSKTR
ncbi:hypothetical protein [Glycomyces buryatensis]|uniref:Uncharacterized protein n=1 Tax=Glycomyces buryatensis TaxID=2570927 RepID=A0A4S8Q5H1_9ACTN|nr:hypothetical protein [Glycomyces buryatensis]THV39503.1 hypothetical protein FAB82_18010 [Glycomyces buryatensis]